MSEGAQLRIFGLCRALISAASLLLAFSSRFDWKREWLAELYSRSLMMSTRRPGLAVQAALLFRCVGAFQDALCLTWDQLLASISPNLRRLALGSALSRSAGLFVYAFSALAIRSLHSLFSYKVLWAGEVVICLTSFLLVCSFFHRACLREEKIWRFTRLLLAFVFVIVLAASWFSLSRDYKQVIAWLTVEFEQNLYFTCLVLTMLLYLLMQQLGSRDEELELLVCGMGMQFAGSAASLALVTLTQGARYSELLGRFILPLCTLGMILAWIYAVIIGGRTTGTEATNTKA